jgi:ribosomal protein S27AE
MIPSFKDWLARKPKGPAPRKRLARKVRVRKVSPKRRQQLGFYRILRKGYLELQPTCERCGATATEIHHKKRRLGDMLNQTRHFMATCPECHRWIHMHPREARELGLLL